MREWALCGIYYNYYQHLVPGIYIIVLLGHVGQHCPGLGGMGLGQSGAAHSTTRQSIVGGSVGAEHRGQHSPGCTIGLAPSSQICKIAGQKQRDGSSALAAHEGKVKNRSMHVNCLHFYRILP